MLHDKRWYSSAKFARVLILHMGHWMMEWLKIGIGRGYDWLRKGLNRFGWLFSSNVEVAGRQNERQMGVKRKTQWAKGRVRKPKNRGIGESIAEALLPGSFGIGDATEKSIESFGWRRLVADAIEKDRLLTELLEYFVLQVQIDIVRLTSAVRIEHRFGVS